MFVLNKQLCYLLRKEYGLTKKKEKKKESNKSENGVKEEKTMKFKQVRLIDWGLTPFLTISQLFHGGQFTYSCISWFSHTSTPHISLPKQLAAFPHRLSPLVEDEWRMSHWLFVNRRKESWPSRDSNSQPLDWQPASLPTKLPGLGQTGKNSHLSEKL